MVIKRKKGKKSILFAELMNSIKLSLLSSEVIKSFVSSSRTINVRTKVANELTSVPVAVKSDAFQVSFGHQEVDVRTTRADQHDATRNGAAWAVFFGSTPPGVFTASFEMRLTALVAVWEPMFSFSDAS